MKAIILAAGQGTRLIPLTEEKPKALVRAAGLPILQHQIEAYLGAGIAERDIFVAAGYLAEKIRAFLREKYGAVNIVENSEYTRTNNMYSLWLALRESGKEGAAAACISNGDCVYEKSMVKKFAEDKRGNLVACKAGIFNDEAMKIAVSGNGNIVDISKELGRNAHGLSMDLFKMDARAQARLVEIMENYFARRGKNDWNEMALPELFGEHRFAPFDAGDSAWTEIDNLADLQDADRLFSPLRLADKTCLVLDWDGTLFLGPDPVKPALDFLKRNAQRFDFFFLSNNTSLLPKDLSAKLQAHGLSFRDAQFITPLAGIAKLFADGGIRRAFVVANSRVRAYLGGLLPKNTDLQCADAKKCDAVVLCYDTELTYEKLKTATLLLRNERIRYVATHLDRVCPSPEGALPDIGSMIAALECASGREPEISLGKPNPAMLEEAVGGRSRKEIAVAGDRLYTDHALAQKIGCDFICVLSGETTRADLERAESFPELVVEHLGALGDLP